MNSSALLFKETPSPLPKLGKYLLAVNPLAGIQFVDSLLNVVPQLLSRHQESHAFGNRILGRRVFSGSNQVLNELHGIGGQVKIHVLLHGLSDRAFAQ
jgi:hypothetical protein